MYSKIAGSMSSSKFCCEGGMYTTRHWLQSKHRMIWCLSCKQETSGSFSMMKKKTSKPRDGIGWADKNDSLSIGIQKRGVTECLPNWKSTPFSMLWSWSNGIKFISTCMSKEIMSHGSSEPKVEEQNTQCRCNPTKVAVGKLSNEVGFPT